VKTPESVFNVPPAGPEKAKELETAVGVTELDGAEAALAPKALSATTEQA
jgi:hypothetical protein